MKFSMNYGEHFGWNIEEGRYRKNSHVGHEKLFFRNVI